MFRVFLPSPGKGVLGALLLIAATPVLRAQSASEQFLLIGTDTLYGTLTLPATDKPAPVVLMIAGSGPTDRDGNNPMMSNNAYRIAADSLQRHGIASLRYDKRGIAKSQGAGASEADLRFEHYIDDAAAWIRLLKADKRFSSVTVFGHSEGSLIGMVAAAKAGADAFISVAGPGESADKVLKRQLAQQAPQLAETCNPIIDSLKDGHTVNSVNPMLMNLFRPQVQPYLISWFRYDPQTEIARLTIPVLIIQGTTDLQVTTADAAMLAKAKEQAQLKIISGMNHVLKDAPNDLQQNFATYGKPELPVNAELVTLVTGFIQSLRK
jgi:pimeloyl-ACP methyl ester carboxylesterase